MSDSERLLEVDRERRAAMVDASPDVLARLLADDLVWTHSSGKTESKKEVIAAIEDGAVSYEAIEMAQDRVLTFSEGFVHQGLLRGRAVRDGQVKMLNARFLSVWREVGSQLQMIAWQSTNCSD